MRIVDGSYAGELVWHCLHYRPNPKLRIEPTKESKHSPKKRGLTQIKRIIKHLEARYSVDGNRRKLYIISNLPVVTISYGIIKLSVQMHDTRKSFTSKYNSDITPLRLIVYLNLTLPQILAFTINKYLLRFVLDNNIEQPRGKIYHLNSREDSRIPDLIFADKTWQSSDWLRFLDAKTFDKLGICNFELRPPKCHFMLLIYVRPTYELWESDIEIVGHKNYKSLI